MFKKWVILPMLCVMLIAGCSNEVKPVEVKASDTCAVCNMKIENLNAATQIILENDKVLMFDDIGCMYTWMSENSGEKTKAKFVRDNNSGEWIELDKATFVYNKMLKTPMAYGVVSFVDKKDAEAFAAENEAEVLTAADLDAHKWEMNMEMKGNMKHDHHDKDSKSDGHNH